jgi:hypothetical protein
MRSGLQRRLLHAALMSAVASPLYARTTTPIESRSVAPVAPTTINETQNSRDAISVLDSLKEDVAHHPNDFVRFETRTAANQFIEEHEDVVREMDRRVVQRGIVGYWEGKTLVLLPSLSGLAITRRY